MTARPIIVWSKAVALCLAASACLHSPTAPSSALPRLGLAGQSNAVLLRPILAEVAWVTGAGDQGATPITCWSGTSIDGICWRNLQTALRQDKPLDAFIWWQGESDADNSNYAEPFRDLIARVRAETAQPRLLILVVQWGSVYGGRHGGAEDAQRAFVASDSAARFVRTDDLPFRDGTHMTDDGYRQLSARIVGIVKGASK